MKTPLIVLAALATGAGLFAQADSPRSSYSISSDFTYTTKYVFRGLQLAKDSFQPSVEATIGNPLNGEFYANLWTNLPVIRHENDEIDFRGGYRRRVTSELSLEALVAYYWYPEAHTFETHHSTEAGVGMTYDAGGYAPSATAYYYHDFDLRSDTLEISAGYGIPIPSIGTSLDLNVYVGTTKSEDWEPDSGVIVGQSYSYYGADVRVPYRLSQNTKITVGAHWAATQNYLPGVSRNHFWVDIGFTAGF